MERKGRTCNLPGTGDFFAGEMNILGPQACSLKQGSQAAHQRGQVCSRTHCRYTSPCSFRWSPGLRQHWRPQPPPLTPHQALEQTCLHTPSQWLLQHLLKGAADWLQYSCSPKWRHAYKCTHSGPGSSWNCLQDAPGRTYPRKIRVFT